MCLYVRLLRFGDLTNPGALTSSATHYRIRLCCTSSLNPPVSQNPLETKMAYQTTLISGSGYGNIYVDALIWGDGWIGSDITYSFDSGSHYSLVYGAISGAVWNDSEISAVNSVLTSYSAVCNLTFIQNPNNYSTSNLSLWSLGSSKMGTNSGLFQTPDGTNPQIEGYFNYSIPGYFELRPGGEGYQTFVHEIGHALGLAHPHGGGTESDASIFPDATAFTTGTYGLNQGVWTTMSYNVGWNFDSAGRNTSGWSSDSMSYGRNSTPMAFDIAALQALYGANTTYNTGDNIYTLDITNGVGTDWSCIWDAGGNDTISNLNSSTSCTIDLRAAPLTGVNAGGYISSAIGIYGGFTIANGVSIENALGGSGNDTLIGNGFANFIMGGAGNDTLIGGGGNDTLLGGDGNDRILGSYGDTGSYFIDGGDGNDYIDIWTSTNNTVNGGAGEDILSGSFNVDTLIGGDGDDSIRGFGGADTFVVDAGRDTISDLGNGADVLTVAAGATANATVTAAWTATAATSNSGVANISTNGMAVNLAAVTSGSAGYSITNTGSATTLTGSAFADTLKGGSGIDILVGGFGNDTYVVDSTADLITELLSGGTDTVISSVTQTVLAANVENLTLTGTAAINGTGNTLANTLVGNAGNNTLNGGEGADRMLGGAGNDLYVVDNTSDRVYETTTTSSGVDAGGIDTVQSSVSLTLGQFVENLTLTGTAAIKGTGNSLNNTLVGNAGNNTLNGGEGADTLMGGLGTDILIGGAGADRLYGGLDTVEDIFKFLNIADSNQASRDSIYNFISETDTIDLSGIDANGNLTGNQAFLNMSINSNAQDYSIWGIRSGSNFIISADTDGNASTVDFQIQLIGITQIDFNDIVV